MRSLSLPVVILVATGACAEAPAPYNTPGDSAKSILNGVDGGRVNPDSGVFSLSDGGGVDGGPGDGGDAGPPLPTQVCTGDSDGRSQGPPLVISELYFGSPAFIEFYYRGVGMDGGTIDPAGLSFQSTPALGQDVPLVNLAPGQYALGSMSMPTGTGEIALFQGNVMEFYVCWGQLGTTTLQLQASQALLWTTLGVCPSTPPSNESLHLQGAGTNFGDWSAGPPSPLGCALAR